MTKQTNVILPRIFIFEGIDGSGKSTMCKIIKEKLEKELPDTTVHILQEPGCTELGKEVRNIIKSDIPLTPLQQLNLFNSATQQTHILLRSLLKGKNIMLVDRSVFSTMVYQQPNDRMTFLDKRLFNEIKKSFTDTYIHDLLYNLQANVFILDVDANESIERQKARGDYDDRYKADTTKANNRRALYLELADKYNLPVIKSEDQATTTNKVWNLIKQELNLGMKANKQQAELALKTLFGKGADDCINQNLLYPIAESIHYANRVVQIATGESKPDLDQHLLESIYSGIRYKLENPDATPEDQHNCWCDFKRKEGWVYGEIKDMHKKQHPCLVPYDDLPNLQKLKDKMFHRTLAQSLYALGFTVWEI